MEAERIAAALRYQQGLAAARESATPTDILGGQLSDESSVNRLLAALQHQEQWSTPAQQPAMTQQQQDQMSHTNSFGSGGEEFFAQQRRDREFDATEAQNLYERERYGRTLGGVEQSLEPFTGGTMEQNIRNTLPNVIGASVGGGGVSSGISAAKNNSLKGWAKLFGPQGMFSPNVPMSTLPMNVWHGSPHRFSNVDESNPMGQFDISKVGTGEGEQAYGHGIYNAERKDVAQGYQGSTTFADQKRSFLDVLPEDAEFDEVIELIGTGHFTPDQDRVLKALKADDWLGFDYPSQAISAAYSKNLNNWDPSSELVDSVKSAGHIYEADLPDEDIAKMLDWDAPLSEQPQAVRDALGLVADADGRVKMPNGERHPVDRLTGERIYHAFSEGALSPEAASAKLNELGIPGIKYLDRDSRASGEGTRNFVSFDPTRVKILSRNGERAAPTNALAMDEASRMGRAAEQEFDVDAYHYSRHNADIDEFKPGTHDLSPFGIGTHVGDSGQALDRAQKTTMDGATYPLKIKTGRQLLGDDGKPMGEESLSAYMRKLQDEKFGADYPDYKEKQKWLAEEMWRKYDSIPYINDVEGVGRVSHILPPKNIRSRFAAFDPKNKNLANLLGKATPEMLGAIAAGSAAGVGYAAHEKKPKNAPRAP